MQSRSDIQAAVCTDAAVGNLLGEQGGGLHPVVHRFLLNPPKGHKRGEQEACANNQQIADRPVGEDGGALFLLLLLLQAVHN
ncbi:hypothetical protein D3C74_437870 [compost metagenome]